MKHTGNKVALYLSHLKLRIPSACSVSWRTHDETVDAVRRKVYCAEVAAVVSEVIRKVR